MVLAPNLHLTCEICLESFPPTADFLQLHLNCLNNLFTPPPQDRLTQEFLQKKSLCVTNSE